MTARRLGIAIAGLVVIALVLAYALHFDGAFVWDDKGYLLDNPRLARGAPFLAAIETPLSNQVFRPVSTGTLWLEVQVHGFSMIGFRVVQLALHLGCGIVLFSWLKRHLASPFAALVGAAIFLLHPAATEGVMFANARHDVLGTFLALLAMFLCAEGRSTRRALLAGVCSAFAIGCKESYVVLVPLLALQVLVAPDRSSLVPRLMRAITPTSLSIVLVFGVRRALGISAASAVDGSVWSLARAFAALITRHVTSFVTFADAPTAQRYVPSSTIYTTVLLAIVAAVAIVLVWRLRREDSPLVHTALLGTAILLLGLLPSIAAIPATGQYGNRYGYFALAGFSVLVATGATSILAWLETRTPLLQRVAIGCAIVTIPLIALETSARAGDWRDGLTLFGVDVERIPDDSRANYHFGVEVLAARGCADALPYFQRATQEEPSWPRPFRNVAGCLLRLGRPLDAIVPARRAVELEPAEAAHHRNLAAALVAVGQLDEAKAQLAEAERLAPGAPQNEAIRRSFPAPP